MALHLALDQVELVHHADGALAVAHELAVALHGAQAALEQLFLVVLDLQQAAQIVLLDRHALLRQHLQDIFAARQRMFVRFALAFQVRIELHGYFFCFLVIDTNSSNN